MFCYAMWVLLWMVWGLGAEHSGEQHLGVVVVADDSLGGLNSWPWKDRKNWYPSLRLLPWDQLKLWNEPRDEWPEGGCEITCPSKSRVSVWTKKQARSDGKREGAIFLRSFLSERKKAVVYVVPAWKPRASPAVCVLVHHHVWSVKCVFVWGRGLNERKRESEIHK